MATNSEVQQMAQEEIDNIIGTAHLPTWEDREWLPYVSAIVKEALRWFVIVPMNTPHKTDEEIEYQGYRIPKGSFLVVSHWWLLHDPETYHDQSSFEPLRFLAPRNEPDPSDVAFGSGHRVCPGQHLAKPTLFLTISRLLAAFKIGKVDKNGEFIEPKLEWRPGNLAQVKEFPYSIIPRSEAHIELVRAAEKEYPWQKGDAEQLDIPASY